MVVDKHGKEIKVGDQVKIWGHDRARVVGMFPAERQGFRGMVTVDTGAGCHEYVPPSAIEVLDGQAS